MVDWSEHYEKNNALVRGMVDWTQHFEQNNAGAGNAGAGNAGAGGGSRGSRRPTASQEHGPAAKLSRHEF